MNEKFRLPDPEPCFVRHVKRGSTYEVVGQAMLQTSAPLTDMETMIVYRSLDDGRLWVRPSTEFEDGRFERVVQQERSGK